jgi:hypothetical protein
MSSRSTDPVIVLPPHYHEAHYIRITERGRLFWLNVLSLVPMCAAGLIVFGLLTIYHAWGAPLVIDALPDRLPSPLGLFLLLAILPLHEWIHGLAIRRVGHRPRYGFKWTVLFATADGAFFRRREFIQVALAPLAVISLSGLALMPFLPGQLALWIGMAVVVNAAGAIGDLWMTSVALRFDPSALIQDLEDGMRIFVQGGAF